MTQVPLSPYKWERRRLALLPGGASRRVAVFPFPGYPGTCGDRIERMGVKGSGPRVDPQTAGLGQHE